MSKRSVLITGCSRGLGQETCAAFLNLGWTVHAVMRNGDDILRSPHRKRSSFIPIQADVGTDECIGTIRASILRNSGALDVLVNNAGIVSRSRGIENLTSQELLAVTNVNCGAAARCTQAVLEYMRGTECPRIVNISSRLGSLGLTSTGELWNGRFFYSYRIAKAALNMLTLNLSGELAAEGFSVCAVHPGKLKNTRYAAPDADVDLKEAAKKLTAFIESMTIGHSGKFYDLMSGEEMAW